MELSRHGTGTYTMMDFMLMYSRLTAIRCGGTGDGTGALPDQDSALAGDGLLHGITAAGILHTGMVVTGVAIGEVTGPVTGVRDGIIIADDKMASLRRFKDDVKEAAQGYECGITLEKFSDLKNGDIFEAYEIREIKQ